MSFPQTSFCWETFGLISLWAICALSLLRCVSLSRPPSKRSSLILESAAGLPAGMGGLSDHLFHTAFPRSPPENCRWCFPLQLSLCNVFPWLSFLTYAALQLLTIEGCYWHHKFACIPAGISHEKNFQCKGKEPLHGENCYLRVCSPWQQRILSSFLIRCMCALGDIY